MAQFQAITEGVEVNGETILSIVVGMGALKAAAYEILAKNGISQPEPGKWYSQQAWLDSFRVISLKYRPITLVCIGRKIPENAKFPPEINNIERALQAIDVAYHMNHRISEKPLFDPSTGEMWEGIGHYHYNRTGQNTAVLNCDNPYPCDFDKGIIDEMAFIYRPIGNTKLSVIHDDSKPCRKKGADSCTYLVEW